MRKLMWFTIGFAAACCVGAYWVSGIGLLLLSAVAIFLLLLAALVLQGRKNQILILLLGCVLGFGWSWGTSTFSLREVEAYDGRTVTASIEIADYSEKAQYGIAADGKIEMDGKKYPIRIYAYELERLAPGDCLRGEVRLKYTGSLDYTSYYYSIGIPLIGYVDEDAELTSPDKIPIKYFVTVLRQRILSLMDRLFPADTLAFARALLLGDTDLLTYEQNTALTVSGIRHIAAVSGLHISILFGMLYSLVGYRRVLTPVIGLPLLLLFAALTGFTPSVCRACLMQALMILAMLFDREYDAPTALSFAVLTMLVLKPAIIISVGFQMSVACVVGILLFAGKIRNALLGEKRPSKLSSWAATSISISVSTMITVTPLCAAYFGSVSLVSVLTNLLTLWVMSFTLAGIVLACVLGSIWLPLGQAAAWVVAWPMRYVLTVAGLLSKVPFAAVYTESFYVVLWLIFCYVLLLVFCRSKEKHPAVLLSCMALGLGVALFLSCWEPRQDDHRMTVLDVGQGQCILVQTEGKQYMIDCGGYSEEAVADLAAQTLLSQGVFRLDGVILTHYDTDHAGALLNFLTRIPTERLYLPTAEDNGTMKEAILEEYAQSITWVEDSYILKTGTIQLFAGEDETSDNESGLCVLCRLEDCDILITGDRSVDGEFALLKQANLPDLEILVAGHHGSANSTGKALLNATLPELVIISVGEKNSYGHPAEETLARLRELGCQVLRTDQNGTITIRR